MPFRDELDAAYAKIAALESRLSSREPQADGDAILELAAELRSVRSKLQETEAQLSSVQATTNEEKRQMELVRRAERDYVETKDRATQEIQKNKELVHEEILKQTSQRLEALLKQEQSNKKRAEEEVEELAALSRPVALQLYQRRLAESTERRRRLVDELELLHREQKPQPDANAPVEEHVQFQMNQVSLARNAHEQSLVQFSVERLSRICATLEKPAKDQ